MPALVYVDHTGTQRLHVLRERNSIGRLPDNDLVLSDTLVSRRHCVVVRNDQAWSVIDEGSRFGTFVNDERIEKQRQLRLGDTLRLGNTLLRMEEMQLPARPTLSETESTGDLLREELLSSSTGAGPGAPKDSLGPLLAEARATGEELLKWLRDPKTVNLPGTPASTLIGVLDKMRRAEVVFADVKREQVLLSTLTEVGKLISLVTDLDTVLALTMDMALRALGADRGFILLRESERPSGAGAPARSEEKLVPRLSRNMAEIKGYSTSIAEKVVAGGKPVLTMDAQMDARFKSAQSIIAQNVRAVMCVPLRNKEFAAIGAIYVEGRPGNPMFSERGVEFLAGFASQAAISIENAQLVARTALEEQRRALLSRYFSEAVIGEIVGRGEAAMGGAAREVTVMFTDIRGFTSLMETLEPAAAVEMLNEYFTELVDEVLQEKGTLDKFTGDGIMAFWNAPVEQPDHALRAVRAGHRMQQRLKPLLERWQRESRSFAEHARGLSTGIGIHSGVAVVGSIGSPKRLEYTAIGDAVNLAARVQSIAQGGEVIVTLDTLERISGKVVAEPLPPASIKGKTAIVPVFRVTSLR